VQAEMRVIGNKTLNQGLCCLPNARIIKLGESGFK